MSDWKPGDVVMLPGGDVVARGCMPVVNPWMVLNRAEGDDEQIFLEDADIDEHMPNVLILLRASHFEWMDFGPNAPGAGTMYGIRPHKEITPTEAAQMKALAEMPYDRRGD